MLNDLEKKARAATPGPWNISHDKKEYFTPSSIWAPKKRAWDEDDEEYNIICEFPRTSEYGRGSDTHISKDAEFIEAANPETVLKLIKMARSNQYTVEKVKEADMVIKIQKLEAAANTALANLKLYEMDGDGVWDFSDSIKEVEDALEYK